MNYKVLVAAALVAVIVPVDSIEETIPEGWFAHRSSVGDARCSAGVDSVLRARGAPNVTVRCRNADAQHVFGIAQFIPASEYERQRVRFTAELKTSRVNESAKLWIRVDTSSPLVSYLDDLADGRLYGTNDWRQVSVVTDVTNEAVSIKFGVALNGSGQVWMRNAAFDVVDDDVASTAKRIVRPAPGTHPVNLSLN